MTTAKQKYLTASTVKRKDDSRVDLREEEVFPQFTREDFLSLVKQAITSAAPKSTQKVN
jgi:hypothetical protein